MEDRCDRSGTYAETRAGLSRSHLFIAYTLAIGCVIASGVWFVFVSRYWSVTKLEIEGIRAISREEVSDTTYKIIDEGEWKPWDKRNIFFVHPDALAQAIRDRLFADQVTVDKIYPNVLRLKVVERQRSIILVSKDQFLHVDSNGIVTEDFASSTEAITVRSFLTGSRMSDSSQVPVIVTDLSELATTGYQAAKTTTVHGWLDTSKTLLAKGLRFRYLKLTSPEVSTMSVVMEPGYELILDIGGPLEPQITTYEKFMKAQPKGYKPDEYIDVRIPGKIFTK